VNTSITQLQLDPHGNDFGLRLITDSGRFLAAGQDISVRTRPGRYYAVVRAGRQAAGTYRLSRASRTITRTRLFATPAVAPPRTSVALTTTIQPAVSGPVLVTIERLDPLAGWQFIRAVHTRAIAGRAVITFAPPSEGLYQAHATFLGTKLAATSQTGWPSFRIQGPLTD
jgi:hypothetical protein